MRRSRGVAAFGIAWTRSIGGTEHVIKNQQKQQIGTVRSHLLSKRSPCAWEDIHLALDFSLPLLHFFEESSLRNNTCMELSIT